MSMPTESGDVNNVGHHQISKDTQIGDVHDHFSAHAVPLRFPAHLFHSIVKGFHISTIVVLKGIVSMSVVHSAVPPHNTPTHMRTFVIHINLSVFKYQAPTIV